MNLHFINSDAFLKFLEESFLSDNLITLSNIDKLSIKSNFEKIKNKYSTLSNQDEYLNLEEKLVTEYIETVLTYNNLFYYKDYIACIVGIMAMEINNFDYLPLTDKKYFNLVKDLSSKKITSKEFWKKFHTCNKINLKTWFYETESGWDF